MKVETIEQQIAKNEERLKQLKAQKQAVLAREKARQKHKIARTIPDVNFTWFVLAQKNGR